MDETLSLGWLPDFPDYRDYTSDSTKVSSDRLKQSGEKDSIKEMLDKVGVSNIVTKKLKLTADLREWCPPVEQQGKLQSCTAHAATGLIEYFENRAFGKFINASRLFLYKATRNLLHWTTDTGAFLRTTMGALVLFGVPPEEYWGYKLDDVDKEPPAFCYAFAQNYRAISYYRLDPPGTQRDILLRHIKTNLMGGLPLMFGFTVYNSISQARSSGMIPFPTQGETIPGGHAVMAVGYDDNLKIKNVNAKGIETKGALLIRNSWGTEWGMGGYGWLPYEYILQGLAVDWWSVIKSAWVDTGQFSV
jgi:C1A family cysteine protease